MKTPITLLLLASALAAQMTVAPTAERVGPPRGETIGGYNILNSFETGYRFASIDGNRNKYRSDVNYLNGIRLLSSSLTVNSREGQGRLFDEILLNTQGLGNDPYQSASLRIQKNKLYRYDLLWRENYYFNPALTISNGQHLMDSTRRLQDHTFTLFPQASFQVFGGYSRNLQEGAGQTTVNFFDHRGDEFPLFTNVRREQNEYRIGAELRFAGFKLVGHQGWEFFKDDTPASASNQPGNNATDRVALTRLYRAEPYHGETPTTRVNLFTERKGWFALNGRFAYASTRRNFIFDEASVATNRFGAAQNRQLILFGNGSRPVTAANLTASVFAGPRVVVSNHTSFHQTRINGDSTFRDFDNATLNFTTVDFRFLGIKTITNTTDLDARVTNWMNLHAGYHVAQRDIASERAQTFDDFTDAASASQTNVLHAGQFGLRLQPVKPLTFTFDGEIGRANRPIYPTSERNYHGLWGRVQWKQRNLRLGAAFRNRYNFNFANLWSHSTRSRHYSLDASWTPNGWFGVDAAYSKLHLDTITGIAYFFQGSLNDLDRSYYVSNLHTGFLQARFRLKERVDLFVGYSRTQDAGDGRSTPLAGTTYSSVPAFQVAQTFPMTFESPLARLSFRLHNRVRLNVGWQWYRYLEEFRFAPAPQDYRAHTGYTSVLWSF